MKNVEDNTNIVMKKILKPVAEPITAFINQSNNVKQPMHVPEERVNNNSETSYFQDSDCASSDLSDLEYKECNQEINNINFNKRPDISQEYQYKNNNNSQDIKELKRSSLQNDDLINLYNNTIGVNIPFGIRNENEKLFMGKSNVKFSKTANPLKSNPIFYITLDDKSFELTPGINELLLKKKPNLALVTEKDKLIYKHMLSITNVHKRDFQPDGQLKGDRSIKYREIIRPLFLELTDLASGSKSGGSLPKLKKYNPNTDLIYWDNPNELIDRLKILVASRSAGNDNHDNGILAIIEELKEAGIIKE